MREKVPDTLIMTSAINPVCEAPGVKITDPRIRLFQLCCSVICWARTDGIANIVICDNTMPTIRIQPLQQFAANHGKRLEFLTFLTDRGEVERRGKGYGEGEIVKYVFENSALFKDCKSFYKVTGRIHVDNFELIHKAHRQHDRVFDNPISTLRRYAKRVAVHLNPGSRHGKGMVRTVFYKCDTRFFRENLLGRAAVVDDHNRFYLEHAYFLPLIKAGFNTFAVRPELVGISSSSGQQYQGRDFSEKVRTWAVDLVKDVLPECR